MDLSQLEYFRALAHIRHFTKAAASISISQSALSRSITKLENELGHPLFDRTGHEISLTPDGQRFLIHVERALSEIEEGRRELDHENDPQGGIINLSFIHSLGTYMLPVLLSEFKVQNPSTRFNLQQNDSTLLAQGLIDGTSDLCLGSTMITMKHIAWSYLYSEEIYITVPLHHRLADWEQATLKDIENEPFITMKPSYSLRILTNRVCALANVHPKIIFEGDDTNTIASLVASNLGVSLLPKIPGSDAIGIRQIHVSFPSCKREIGIAWNMTRPLSPAALRFHQFIVKRFADKRPSTVR